jgi:hypothetical protein
LTPTIGDIDGLPALVVLEGGWRDEYADAIEQRGLAALSIMVRGGDLTFLERLPDLRGLVLNAGEARDLSPVSGLRALETLTLNVVSKPRMELDLAAFERLRILRAYWNPGFESMFGSASLESLYMFSQPDPDLSRFGALPALRRLELSQGRKLVSTRGVGPLRFLGLYQQGGLTELRDLPAGLEELAIEGCKRLDTIDAVAGLALKRLKVANCGEIASLSPLAGMESLEQFLAWESTRIVDGDLSVLLTLPRLRMIGMRDRREYRPRVSEIEAALGG